MTETRLYIIGYRKAGKRTSTGKYATSIEEAKKRVKLEIPGAVILWARQGPQGQTRPTH